MLQDLDTDNHIMNKTLNTQKTIKLMNEITLDQKASAHEKNN